MQVPSTDWSLIDTPWVTASYKHQAEATFDQLGNRSVGLQMELRTRYFHLPEALAQTEME